ncbi:membrane protein insertase YidC [Bacteroidota bacterium]
MDRNSIIGFFLIAAILIGFYFVNKPSEQEIAETQRKADSIMAVQDSLKRIEIRNPAVADSSVFQEIDSAQIIEDKKSVLPVEFASFATGPDHQYTLENELLKVRVSPKGGRISSVELKNYKTYSGEPLVLFDGDEQEFGYQFSASNQIVQTKDLFFSIEGDNALVSENDSASISMFIKLDDYRYIEHKVTLYGNSYLVGFQINMVGLDQVIPKTLSYIDLTWKTNTRYLERKAKKNNRIIGSNPTVYYRYVNEKPDRLNDAKDEKEDLVGKVQWVALKQHFFTQTLITSTSFISGQVQSETLENDNFQRKLSATLVLPFNHNPEQSYNMKFYYGPNHYKTLKKFKLELEEQVFLGRNILRLVNVGVVIPVFNFLSKYIANYGIIIFLLTLIIKIILLPLTYRSFLSTAKMKVLKPELDELKEKVGKDQVKMQQEQLKLYRQAGVSPMGGCLPMVLQMPILIALFRFFPSSIELRQQGFLWAHDLSTYDSIWDFPNAFSIPFYGDHISLFTLLMTISTLIYTKMNSQMMGGGGNDAMAKQMKIIQYVMPIMFLGFFNNYSAGLSYYYFLANMITFGQQYLFKQFINEDKLRKKIEDNKKKKSGKSKSKWQQRLEDLQKQQRQQSSQRKR